MKKFGFLIFIVALVIGLIFANISAIKRMSKDGIDLSFDFGGKTGSGNVAIEQRNIEEFSAVDSSGMFKVEIVLKRDRGVEVEADDNLLPFIKTNVRRGVLRLETDGKLRTSNPIRVRIFTNTIEKVSGSGITEISVSELDSKEFTVDASGASKVKVAGKTASFTVDSSGASKIDATGLQAENAAADLSGASELKVQVIGTLNAKASGAAKVYYVGSPTELIKKTSGAGKVLPLE
ncbi:MAG: DUF2807 domain-containing protein [Acidobacteria bacterium]|nr:DUF2807 domain-containing protein [Acidobacteriota bacterium]